MDSTTGSSSESTFATLTPANAAAKAAFSAVFVGGSQEGAASCRRFMHVKPEQEYDRDVLRFHHHQKRKLQEQELFQDDTVSQTPTEPDTETELESKHLGMVWSGHYIFDLTALPFEPESGWTAGTNRKNEQIDFVLTTKQISARVRTYHARFNFHPHTGFLFVSKVSRAITAEIAVDGIQVQRGQLYGLNQSSMTIWIGQLQYIFQYLDFASSPAFYKDHQNYMKDQLTEFTSISSITPTPTGRPRIFGGWTLGRSLGRGGFGKVYTATNSRNEIAAIKVQERVSKTAYQIGQEVRVLRSLKELSEREDDEGRLVRLRDVIYENETGEHTSTKFEDVAFVLEPAVENDFTDLINIAARQRSQTGQ